MNTLWLIAKKELAHSLNSQLAAILALIFVISLPVPLLWSGGSANIYLNGHSDLRAFFMMLPLFLMVFVPALAMRAWAEERGSGTMELLVSLPISDTSLVLGKFLGLYALLCACILATGFLPLLVNRMGDLDWGPVIGGYCAALLLAACCLAAAMFAGSLTRNQVTAFILGFLLLAVLMFMNLPQLNPHSRFLSIARGMIDSRDLIFYILATILFLFLNTKIIQAGVQRGSLVGLLAFPLILGAVYLVSNSFYLRRDLTADRLYTLNETSIRILQQLEKPVHIKLYLSEDLPSRFQPVSEYIQTLVNEYATRGGQQVKVTTIDPGARLDLVDEAHKLGIYETKANITEHSRVEMVYIWFGMAIFHEDRHEVFPTLTSLDNFEYDVTSAINRLTRYKKPVLKFAGPTYNGLGGYVFDLDQQLKPLYEELSKGFEVEQVRVDGGDQPLLDDADVVVAWGLHQFKPKQLHALDQYLVKGGNLLLLASAAYVDPINVTAGFVDRGVADDFYAHLGFRVNRDLVADQTCTKIKYTQTRPPVLKEYPLFPALYADRGNFPNQAEPTGSLASLILPWASSLELLPQAPNPIVISARTSDQSWLLTGTPQIDPARVPGPTSFDSYTVGLTINGSFASFFDSLPVDGQSEHLIESDASARVHVWSSEHLLTQTHNPSIPAFMAHTIEYLAAGAGLAGIDRREKTFRPIREMTLEEKNRFKWLSVTLAPALIILFSIGRHLIRRRRNNRYAARLES